MSDPRADSRWQWVAWSMAAGAAFDLFFAAAILGATDLAARWLGLAVPTDPVYLHLNGILLLLLGGIYLLPVLDPRGYRGVVAVAAAGRLVGATFLVGAWWHGRPVAFLAVGGVDLVLAGLHAALLAAAYRAERPSSRWN